MFKGSIVALVTPMQADGSIDKKSLHDLIEWHIRAKTDGLVIAGTTGESATLTEDEQFTLISDVVKQVAGRIPVIAGTGTHSTQHTIALTRQAKKAGADAALIVTPYYNKPTQAGLVAHYKAIAEAVNIPIILYNVPGRTACDLLPDTIGKLANIRNIIGIKEATGNIKRAAEIHQQTGSDFLIYSGDDATAFDLMLQGAKGVISVTANIAPTKMHELCQAALSGDQAMGTQINETLMGLHQKLFLESNPIPTKWALCEMGLIPPGIRLPLVSLDPKYHSDVHEAMRKAGVI